MTTRKRGQYLAEQQAIKVIRRIDSINLILKDAAKSKGLEFRNFTHLSEYVAQQLSSIEGSNVSGSTIRRNESYADAIREFLMSKKNAVRKLENNEEKRLKLTMELAKSRRDIVSLEHALEDSYSKISQLEQASLGSRIGNLPATKKPEQNQERILLALKKTIRYFDFIEIDYGKGEVLDGATEDILFNKDDCPEFFEYMQKDHLDG